MRNNIFGPGPRGEQTLEYDRHVIVLQTKLSNDPELRESLEFILDEAGNFNDRVDSDLTLAGMTMKSDFPDSPAAREHGRDLMIAATNIHRGGNTILGFFKGALKAGR
jgi:hypothetical protein